MGAEKHLSIVISFNGHGNSNETTVSGIRTQKPTPLVTVDVARQRSFLLKDHKQGGYSYSLQNFFRYAWDNDYKNQRIFSRADI